MRDENGRDLEAFLSYVRSVRPSRHILRGRRGSEENVKTKLVVPLLQALGWDLLEDMDFERRGADIVLHSQSEPAIIVEVKAWGEEVTNHLDQCLEYSLKLKTPWVVITSGEDLAVYSSLLDAEDLLATDSLCRIGFHSLQGDKGAAVLQELASLIGKAAFKAGHHKLSALVTNSLEDGRLRDARQDFEELASGFDPAIRSRRLTRDEFLAFSREHRQPVRKGLVTMYEGITDLASLDDKIRVRYRSRSIGLEYRLERQPRTKTLGLVGIYPDQAKIGFGLQNWRQLDPSERLYDQLAAYPREVRSERWAKDLLETLREALLEIVQSPPSDRGSAAS